jgi:COP9 signalosome complex subunit 1
MDADDDSSSSLETVANVDDDNNQTNHRQTISSYISPYSGRTRISRLLFIAGDCSSDDTSMKLEALRLAFDEIKKGEDTFLMEKTVNQIHGRLGSDYTRDDAWFDAVKKKADQKEKDLESDLTFYMVLIIFYNFQFLKQFLNFMFVVFHYLWSKFSMRNI